MAWWWLSCNLISIVVLAFYSMVEMACVSVNRARLHFYAMEGNQPARWLQQLLQHPSRLFGTTLIGVNLATVIGSECAREFHASIGLDPDLAPISQVFLVVIFGELAPMFAARNYAEHVALLGAPLLYLSSRLLAPMLWSLELITNFINYLAGDNQTSSDKLLSREELQKMLESQEDSSETAANQELSNVSASLFKMHKQTVEAAMTGLDTLPVMSAAATIKELRQLWNTTPSSYLALYQDTPTNIVGILLPRDVMRAPDEDSVRDYAHSPWFVTSATSLSHMIKQFRRNNQNIAIVIDNHGCAIGVVTFAAIINEVFGVSTPLSPPSQRQGLLLWEKTLTGDMTVGDFYRQFGVRLEDDDELSLADLVMQRLEHHPNVGDKISIGPYEITVKTASLLDPIKTISITGRAAKA
jgi:putative hemolysin